MNANEIMNLNVVELSTGAHVGHVRGLMVDAEQKKVAAIAISGGGTFSRTRYVPFESIRAVGNDVVTIPSGQSTVERRNISQRPVLDSISSRRVLTEDGRDIGVVRDYEFDPQNGAIKSITFGQSTRGILGGILGLGHEYQIQIDLVQTLGENVVVDNSVPEIVGYERAA